uniref:Uncharacterized protein n=1 Tax=Tetradesmus obliquus TaxID=3088 RepID=A0A383VC38_TETOB
MCVLAALQSQAAADPKLLLRSIFATALRNSRVFAVDVVLPGLLLTWLELRARRAWWQQQQARQQQLLLQLRSEAAAHKKENDEAAAAAAPAAGPSCSAAPQPQSSLPPAHQDSISAASSNPFPDAINAHLQTPATPAAAAAAAAPLPVPAATVPSSAAAAPAPAPPPALQPAAADAGAMSMHAGAAVPLPAAVSTHAHGAAAALQLPGQQQRSALYRSPVQRCVVSLKFSEAPGPGSQGTAMFQLQLAAAVEASVLAASAATGDAAGSAAAQQQQQTAVMVTGVAAFPGCWQVVMHLVLPQGADLGSQLQQLQQQVQEAAQGVLAAHAASAADCRLMSALLQPLVAEGYQASAGQATATAAAAAAAAAVGTLAAAPAVAGMPAAVAAAGGVYMHPAALPLPPSSSSSSGELPETAVNVCIAQSTLAQLLAAGQRSVRVVVTAQQPGQALLLDATWQLLPIAEAGTNDLQLPLLLQLSNNEGMQDGIHQQQPVASVMVLASNRLENSTGQATSSPAAATEAESLEAALQGSSRSHPHAAVLAKLPLLLLPHAAAAELQQLHAGLSADGLAPAAAYQELLPLLQDLAVVLGGAAAAQAGSAAASRHHLLDVLKGAIAACFEQQGLVSCLQLLHNAGVSTAEAEAVAADAAAAAPVLLVGSHASEVQHGNTAAAAAALSPAGAPADSGGASNGKQGSLGLANRVELEQGQLERLMPSCTSSSGTSSSSITASSKPTGSSSSAEAGEAPSTGQQAAVTGTAPTVGFSTLVFGFPASMEAAYLAYKSRTLRCSDFLSMITYAMGLAVSVTRLTWCVATGSAVQARIAALRGAFLIVHVITHGVLWAASTAAQHRQRLAALQQQRSAVLAACVSLALSVFAAAALCRGAWGAAGVEALRGGKPAVYCALMVYRHLVQPARLRIGLLPTLLLAAEYMAFDVLFLRPQLPGLSPNATALLLVSAQLSLAAWLELSLRRSFTRSLRM